MKAILRTMFAWGIVLGIYALISDAPTWVYLVVGVLLGLGSKGWD